MEKGVVYSKSEGVCGALYAEIRANMASAEKRKCEEMHKRVCVHVCVFE